MKANPISRYTIDWDNATESFHLRLDGEGSYIILSFDPDTLDSLNLGIENAILQRKMALLRETEKTQ